MSRRIIILGSTGSIGTQTLQVIDRFTAKFTIAGLSAGKNIDLLERQIRKYRPEVAAVADEERAVQLRNRTRDTRTAVIGGEKSLLELASWPGAELVVVALVGFSGFQPTLAAVKEGRTVALANKEALVVGGELITAAAKQRQVFIIPVDSEHSAIFQCLHAGREVEVKKVILTASGGPFLGKSLEQLKDVKPSDALNHPNWEMGQKVTVDSATLMNKGFEVLEARWLFGLEQEKIDVVIHPESIVHSMVEFIDGSVIAQMGLPEMLLPIQYALSYPQRWEAPLPAPDWKKGYTLNFLAPDRVSFPCLDLACRAGEKGGTLPAVLNAANEITVHKFLQGKLSFLHLPVILEKVMDRHEVKYNPSPGEIIDAHYWAIEEARIGLEGNGPL